PPFTDYVGTRWYRAPECLLRDRGYSSPVDVWGSGLVFAELLRGSPIFMGSSSIDQLYKIFAVLGQPISDWPDFARLAEACRFRATATGSGLPTVLPRASSRVVALLSEILMLNPRRRPMARKVLEHAYFNSLPPFDPDRLDTARSSASAMGRSDSRNSFQMNDVGQAPLTASDGRVQASRPETPQAPPPPPPMTQAKSEVCVDDVDLDAELDKILGDSPPEAEPLLASAEVFPLRGGSTDSFLLEPEGTPLPEHDLEGDRERRGFPEIPPLHVHAISRAASPDSRGDIMDALLNDLADLGVGDELPSSARQPPPPPPPFGAETEKEMPWSAEEGMELRRIVKRIVRAGNSDKEQIWLEAAQRMGDGPLKAAVPTNRPTRHMAFQVQTGLGVSLSQVPDPWAPAGNLLEQATRGHASLHMLPA
ncbi:unnamed protein product, partial [Effrenium voratum]